MVNTLPKVVEGSKAARKEGRVRKTHYLRGECSKTHSKGGRVGKHTTREVRSRRSSQKEAGLENALPKVVDGPKALLKGGRVGKHTTQGG